MRRGPGLIGLSIARGKADVDLLRRFTVAACPPFLATRRANACETVTTLPSLGRPLSSTSLAGFGRWRSTSRMQTTLGSFGLRWRSLEFHVFGRSA